MCLQEERSMPTREIHEEDLHRSDAGEGLRRETHEEDNPVWFQWRSSSFWCTLPSINLGSPFSPISLLSHRNTSLPINPFHVSSNFTCWPICLTQVSFCYFVAFFSFELLESNPSCSDLLLIYVLKWPIEVKSLIG